MKIQPLDYQAVGFRRASGGTRTRTAVSGQGIFLPLWLSPPFVVCGPDYSFTLDLNQSKSLGVSCLVSAPSSFRRLGSRLPSALPVKASLNLRHSTSFLSERALNLVLPLTHTRKVKTNSRVFQIIIPKNYSKSLVSTISPPRREVGGTKIRSFW